MSSLLPSLPEADRPSSGPLTTLVSAWVVVALTVALLGGVGYAIARIADDRRPAGLAGGAGPVEVRATPEEIEALVGDLSADEWTDRSAATRRLIEIGEPALPLLRQASEGDDLEAAWRAEEAIREIEWRREVLYERTGSSRP